MVNKNQILKGQEGESIAERYFKKQGYKIIFKNFRTKTGEIDLIVEKKGTLVFVEVKACAVQGDGPLPEEKVNLSKRRRIIEASKFFCSREKDLIDRIKEFRYDVVVVDINKKSVVRHYESAFFDED